MEADGKKTLPKHYMEQEEMDRNGVALTWLQDAMHHILIQIRCLPTIISLPTSSLLAAAIFLIASAANLP